MGLGFGAVADLNAAPGPGAGNGRITASDPAYRHADCPRRCLASDDEARAEILRDEGLVFAVPRRGIYVSPDAK
jgi:hypothetical protein